MAIHSSGQAIFNLAHIEGITLGAGEEVAGGASDMGVDRIGEVYFFCFLIIPKQQNSSF